LNLHLYHQKNMTNELEKEKVCSVNLKFELIRKTSTFVEVFLFL